MVSVGFLWLRRNGGCATTDVVTADDAVLLRRVAAGDENAALEELYRRYERRVYVFGLRLLGDRGLAEELVQETFVRLWLTAGRFDACRGSVAAYMFTLARSLATDLLRRPSSRPFAPERAEVDQPTAAHDETDSTLTRLVVNQAMACLSPQHREVLALSYDCDLTQPMIAAILGIPLGTVKTRSYFALRALKLALEERGIHG
jgi:RNA polymerase sigma-70 factor (ECF subfamily)